jgi:UPF0716 protein FxsA
MPAERADAASSRYEQVMGKLLLLLIAVPVAELLVLMQLADAIGGLRAFLLVVASGLIGVQIARMAGWQVIAQSQKALATGTIPSESVLHGALLMLAGMLLITPGVITDGLAVVLLIPWSRRFIGKRLVSRSARAVAEGKLRVVQAQQAVPWNAAAQRKPNMVIDAEGETVASSVSGSEDVKPPRFSS